MEILYLQQDVAQDPRPLFSDSVLLNEVRVYMLKQTKGMNSLKELAWAVKVVLMTYTKPTCLLQNRRYLTGYQHYVLRYEMVSLATLYSLISLSLKHLT